MSLLKILYKNSIKIRKNENFSEIGKSNELKNYWQ